VEQLEDLRRAAKDVNQGLLEVPANDDAELDRALATLVERHANTFLVSASPLFDTRGDRIVQFAAENKLPAIYQFREYAIRGGLISYGPNIVEGYRNAGIYAGRILKGEKPADLPVLQPTRPCSRKQER